MNTTRDKLNGTSKVFAEYFSFVTIERHRNFNNGRNFNILDYMFWARSKRRSE